MRYAVSVLAFVAGMLLFTVDASGEDLPPALRMIIEMQREITLAARTPPSSAGGALEDRLPPGLRAIIEANRRIAFPSPYPDPETVAGLFPIPFDPDEDAALADILRGMRRTQDRRFTGDRHGISGTAHLDEFLPHEKIEEEIRFLFDLLRHGYAGYHYFGGDGVFLPIRDGMLERLAGMDDPLPVSAFLDDLLLPGFRDAIADSRFQIHDAALAPPRHTAYMNDEFTLRADTAGDFVAEIDGAEYRVVGVMRDARPEDAIAPTLTAQGEFAWAFALVDPGPPQDSVGIEVLLENAATGESRTLAVNLPRVAAAPESPATAIVGTDGVAILGSRPLRMGSFEAYVEFFRSAVSSRKSPVLVMDLRGHGGDLGDFVREWVRIHTGSAETGLSAFATAPGTETRTMSELRGFFISYQTEMEMMRIGSVATQLSAANREARAAEVTAPPPREAPARTPIPNGNLVIVLVDDDTASAGELFVGYLRRLENVLIVGTNTRGALLSGSLGRTALPHSGLDVMFGTNLHLRPDLSQFEGAGFMPDLWVPPGESLERALLFVERYGLAAAAPLIERGAPAYGTAGGCQTCRAYGCQAPGRAGRTSHRRPAAASSL